VIIRPIGSFENQAPDVYQTSFNILQARSTMGSDRSDDPPKSGQIRFLRSTFLSVNGFTSVVAYAV